MNKTITHKLTTLIKIINSIYYQIKIQFIFFVFYKKKNFKNISTEHLSENGYVKLKNVIPKNVIENILHNYKNQILNETNQLKNGYLIDINLNYNEVKDFFEYFKKNKIFDICKEYLGNFEILNCKINHQTDQDFDESSMQPHHDTRGNDLKIYVWMSDYNEKSHPLYYLRGSNKKLKFYLLDSHHRRKDILKENMDKVYGDKGDIIIFDTHGWHSHVKKNTAERTVLELTIIPKNYFFRSESVGQSSFNQF